MHIKFKQLLISNFLSFGNNVSINLADKGYVLVSGTNQHLTDNADSNGSGKSALWEAISWCLTGETIRGIRSDIINMYNGATECAVTLHFELDKHIYEVTRQDSVKGSSKLFLKIDGVDKSGKGIKDTEKVLHDCLPELTKDLIGSVIILGQGLPQRFSSNTPSGRKAVLEKLSKSDFMIEDIKERLTNRLTQLNSDQRTLEDTLLKLTSQKNTLQQIIEKDTQALTQFTSQVELEVSIEDLKNTIAKLKNSIETQELSLQDIQQARKTYITELSNISNKFQEEFSRIKACEADALESILSSKYECNSNIGVLTTEIRRMEAISDVCPTCGQKLAGVVKPDTTSKKIELSQYQERLKILTDQETLIKNKYLEELTQSRECESNTKKDLLAHEHELETQENNVRASLKKDQATLQALSIQAGKAEQDLQNYVKNKKEFEARITTNTQTLANIDNEIVYNNKNLTEINARASVVNKMLTIAKRDFRGYLLTNIIDYIDQRAKEYAQDIFDNTKINFRLDGNNLLIAYNGKPYENLSGGERQKVDIIIQFALRDMLCKFSSFSSNILVLDELFDGLDAVGCQRVIELIAKHLTDVESVFIITHHSDIAVPADCVINVIKDCNGVSTVK